MTGRNLTSRRSIVLSRGTGLFVGGVFGIAGLLATGLARGQTTATSAPASEQLRIHVTAVLGGAQYRVTGQKWLMLTTGLDLPEGVEIRTGPKGVAQFTIGNDQVYRVDRLTVARIMRASLLPNGSIKTDVGLQYGRVSKDVDSPERPHDDTIVSPSSTLAVRGTRVSLYDQPPYEPEAVSLTGAAVYQNIGRQLVALGAKGEGTAKVVGDEPSAGQYQLQAIQIDPRGTFAGRTSSENALLSYLGTYGSTDFRTLGVFAGLDQAGGLAFKEGLVGSLPVPQQLFFQLIWQGKPFSDVDISVRSPLGELVSDDNRMVPSGGFKPPPDGIANAQGFGSELVEWVTQFPPGTYTISVSNETRGKAVATVEVVQGATSSQAFLAGLFKDTLTGANATAVHTVTVPVTASVAIPGAVRAAASSPPPAAPPPVKTPRPVERGGPVNKFGTSWR